MLFARKSVSNKERSRKGTLIHNGNYHNPCLILIQYTIQSYGETRSKYNCSNRNEYGKTPSVQGRCCFLSLILIPATRDCYTLIVCYCCSLCHKTHRDQNQLAIECLSTVRSQLQNARQWTQDEIGFPTSGVCPSRLP